MFSFIGNFQLSLSKAKKNHKNISYRVFTNHLLLFEENDYWYLIVNDI